MILNQYPISGKRKRNLILCSLKLRQLFKKQAIRIIFHTRNEYEICKKQGQTGIFFINGNRLKQNNLLEMRIVNMMKYCLNFQLKVEHLKVLLFNGRFEKNFSIIQSISLGQLSRLWRTLIN